MEIIVREADVPLSPAVRGACELLGLDALHVANEGKLLAVVAAEDADRALSVWRRLGQGTAAALVGDVAGLGPTRVLVRGPLGALRLLDEPSGSPLPRIC